jgi:hypothetical protein
MDLALLMRFPHDNHDGKFGYPLMYQPRTNRNHGPFFRRPIFSNWLLMFLAWNYSDSDQVSSAPPLLRSLIAGNVVIIIQLMFKAFCGTMRTIRCSD